MKFNVITLFPNMFEPILGESIIKKARQSGLIDVELTDLRMFAEDKHHTVDDTPYGGGTGMLLKVDVMERAIENAKCKMQNAKLRNINYNDKATRRSVDPTVVLLTPQGEKFTAKMAKELAGKEQLILICGHYEGFDERIREHLVDRQISIGDYVLTGGELPAMIMIDAISRFVPGVLPVGAPDEDSHSIDIDGKPALEYPQYTKPAVFNNWKVPDVLISGDHAKIEQWKKAHTRIL
jgi:tRNA (guanine37-N1)-methyltransferase